jgi:hypothetical protein
VRSEELGVEVGDREVTPRRVGRGRVRRLDLGELDRAGARARRPLVEPRARERAEVVAEELSLEGSPVGVARVGSGRGGRVGDESILRRAETESSTGTASI